MYGNEIRTTDNVINGSELNFQLLRTVRGQERIVGKNVHAESFRPLGHFAADAAHTEHT
ncbi:hypothetical protein D3C80_2029690 [compost metagenome]